MSDFDYLALLIGNTSLRWRRAGRRRTGGRVAVADPLPADVLRLAAQLPCRIASVNPPRLARLEGELGRERTDVTVVGRDVPLPIRNETRRPEQVGVDRLLAALGAWRLAGAAVVVDMGTAITVDLVTEGPCFRGGAILPGPRLWADALERDTALLPAVAIDTVPPSPLGRTTEEAIGAGVTWGTIGAVRALVEALRAEARRDAAANLTRSCALIVTGGAAELFLPHLSDDARYEADLVFTGLEAVA